MQGLFAWSGIVQVTRIRLFLNHDIPHQKFLSIYKNILFGGKYNFNLLHQQRLSSNFMKTVKLIQCRSRSNKIWITLIIHEI